MKILIKRTPEADTRTCDYEKVSVEQLYQNSLEHINHVSEGINFLIGFLQRVRHNHDWTKTQYLKEFYEDFKTGFKKKDWWNMHQKVERHHFDSPEHIQEDIDLIDVLEQIVDATTAGMSRKGEYTQKPISNEILQKAYNNTVKLILNAIEIVDEY